MQTLNQISKYSFLTAGLALALSANPVNAQAFRLGETNGTGTTSTVFKGQTFRFTKGGDFTDNPTPSVLLNSIKFAVNGTVTTGIIAYLYDVTSGGIPTLANINSGGIGSIAMSSASTAITADSDFNVALNSIRFAFTTGELSTANQYGIFLGTTPTDPVRVTAETNYIAGSGYRDFGGSVVTFNSDSLFIVDATAVPFEFEASGGVAILGGLFLANKLKNRKQNDKTDEQA